jgi:hypothetical protein
MRKAGIVALTLGLLWGGLAHAEQAQSKSNDAKADEPKSLIEAVGFRKKCCPPCNGDVVSSTTAPAATAGAPAPGAPVQPVPVENGMVGGHPGHVGPGAPAEGNGEKKSLLGKGVHWSGQFPSWAWRHKPPPPPPPPEMYPGMSWHRYPRSPRDFFMIEP